MNASLKIIIRILLLVIAPVQFGFAGVIWIFLATIVSSIEIIIKFIIAGTFDIDSNNYLIVDRFEDFFVFITNHCKNTLKKYDILN